MIGYHLLLISIYNAALTLLFWEKFYLAPVPLFPCDVVPDLVAQKFSTFFHSIGIIAFMISEDLVKRRYGKHFNVILSDLKQADDLRVLDYDGHHVCYNFSIDEFGEPIYHEA